MRDIRSFMGKQTSVPLATANKPPYAVQGGLAAALRGELLPAPPRPRTEPIIDLTGNSDDESPASATPSVGSKRSVCGAEEECRSGGVEERCRSGGPSGGTSWQPRVLTDTQKQRMEINRRAAIERRAGKLPPPPLQPLQQSSPPLQQRGQLLQPLLSAQKPLVSPQLTPSSLPLPPKRGKSSSPQRSLLSAQKLWRHQVA